MNNTDQQQLIDWATALLEETLVKAAISIHQQPNPGDPVEVSLTFNVTASGDSGQVSVRSPGSRGRTINVEVPWPSAAEPVR